MNIAFTTCSNNFLAQAKTMFRSLQRHHPEFKTFLFLVDKPHPGINYSSLMPAEIIVVDEKIVPGFDDMLQRFTVIELNTVVRPFIIQFLQSQHIGCRKLYYLDPDLCIYGRFTEVEELLENEDLVLTPHFLQPLPIDGAMPFENLALNYGTYNMGFFAINSSTTNAQQLLRWWGERTSRFGHIDIANGYFTDQIWMNLAPIFFDKVHSLKHPGYNMAAWNLHERYIKDYSDSGKILLSSGDDLVAYHFSSWSFNDPELLSPYYTRFNFTNRPDLVRLYRDYHISLLENEMERFAGIPCALPYNRKQVKQSMVKKTLMPGARLMRKIWEKI
jgi:hypothetical protein